MLRYAQHDSFSMLYDLYTMMALCPDIACPDQGHVMAVFLFF